MDGQLCVSDRHTDRHTDRQTHGHTLNLHLLMTVRLGSRCRLVFKTREFRFDYLTNMIDRIEKMSFVYWHFLASRILAEISSVKNTVYKRIDDSLIKI
jgi:hypothetical protein